MGVTTPSTLGSIACFSRRLPASPLSYFERTERRLRLQHHCTTFASQTVDKMSGRGLSYLLRHGRVKKGWAAARSDDAVHTPGRRREAVRPIDGTNLQQPGFKNFKSENGLDSRNKPESSAETCDPPPTMPVIDGLTVLQIVKTRPKAWDVPVLSRPGRGHPGGTRQGAQARPLDFIVTIRKETKIILKKVRGDLEAPKGEAAVPHRLDAVKPEVLGAVKGSQ